MNGFDRYFEVKFVGLIVVIRFEMGDLRVIFFFNSILEFLFGMVRLFIYVFGVFLVCIDDDKCVLDVGIEGVDRIILFFVLLFNMLFFLMYLVVVKFCIFCMGVLELFLIEENIVIFEEYCNCLMFCMFLIFLREFCYFF